MTRLNGSAGSADVTLRSRAFGTDLPFVALRDPVITDSFPYKYENDGYFVFTERMDFKVTIESVSDNGTSVASEFDGYLLEN